MNDHRLPSPRRIPDPSPAELVVSAADLLPADLVADLARLDGTTVVIRDHAFPTITPLVPPDIIVPRPLLPGSVIAARIVGLLSGSALAAGLVATLAMNVTGTWSTAAALAAGFGVVGVLVAAPASTRPEPQATTR